MSEPALIDIHNATIWRGTTRVLDEGRIAADGPKSSVLTADLLSGVYRTPIQVAEIDGYYLAYPGTGHS